MSHMVIYRTADGQPGYHQAEELDEAVHFVERLRNGDGVDGARIFRMEEVNFDFRPYFKVEIGSVGEQIGVPAAPSVPEPAWAGPAPADASPELAREPLAERIRDPFADSVPPPPPALPRCSSRRPPRSP